MSQNSGQSAIDSLKARQGIPNSINPHFHASVLQSVFEDMKTRQKNLEDNITPKIDKSVKKCDLNIPKKSLTFTNQDGTTFTVDLSLLFSGKPGTQYSIYHGFSATETPDVSVIKAGQEDSIGAIHGNDVTSTRTSNSPAYLFFWKDDNLPDVSGFRFGGFVDVWMSSKLTIDGAVGTLYVSDNQTTATSVSYEVVV